MGLSKQFSQRLKDLQKTADSQIDDLEMDIPNIQKRIFSEIKLAAKSLELDKEGKIKPTMKNIRLINKIKLTDLIFTDQYTKAVSEFAGGFDTLAEKTDKLYADT